MKEVLDFLSRLRINNDRAWFNENKKEYQQLRDRFAVTVDNLIREIASFDEELAGVSATDCMYRIYRDIRFSADKTPYKTYFSAYLARGGRKSIRSGYYIHIEPGNCLLGGGLWCPEPPLLKRVRQDIYDHSDEFTAIVGKKEFRNLYTFEGERLKTVPRPFPKDVPGGEWLKYKDYSVYAAKEDGFFDRTDWITQAVNDFRKLYPYNVFMNYTVDEFLDE